MVLFVSECEAEPSTSGSKGSRRVCERSEEWKRKERGVRGMGGMGGAGER